MNPYNTQLRQLHRQGGFHLKDFGYSIKNNARERQRAIDKMHKRRVSLKYLVRRLSFLAIVLTNRNPRYSARLRADKSYAQSLYGKPPPSYRAGEDPERLPAPQYPEDAVPPHHVRVRRRPAVRIQAAPVHVVHNGEMEFPEHGGMEMDEIPAVPQGRRPVRRAPPRSVKVGPYYLRARRAPARKSTRKKKPTTKKPR